MSAATPWVHPRDGLHGSFVASLSNFNEEDPDGVLLDGFSLAAFGATAVDGQVERNLAVCHALQPTSEHQNRRTQGYRNSIARCKHFDAKTTQDGGAGLRRWRSAGGGQKFF